MKYSRWYDVAGFITCTALRGYLIETNTSLIATIFKWVVEVGSFFCIIHYLRTESDDD